MLRRLRSLVVGPYSQVKNAPHRAELTELTRGGAGRLLGSQVLFGALGIAVKFMPRTRARSKLEVFTLGLGDVRFTKGVAGSDFVEHLFSGSQRHASSWLEAAEDFAAGRTGDLKTLGTIASTVLKEISEQVLIADPQR